MYQSKTEASRFAEYLRGLIVNGHYSQFMPSVRKLAIDAGVSTSTAHHAIRLLIEEGLLIPSGATRRARITSFNQVSRPNLGSLLVVSCVKSYKLPTSVMLSLSAMELTLPRSGFSFRLIELPDGEPASIERFRSELRDVRPTHILFVHPPPALLAVRLNGTAQLAVLGPGSFSGRKAYRVEVPHLAVPILALSKAKAAGHRHISFVDNIFNSKLRQFLRKEADLLGLRLTIVPGGSLGSDNWIHHETRIREVCSELKACGATCVLFPQWHDFMTAASGFDQAGLEFPERLSVVVAYRNGGSWHFRGHRLAGCDIPGDLAESIVGHWLKGGAADRELFADLVLRTWDDGETLRKPSC